MANGKNIQKYGVPRTRARSSVADETLFGEPLSKRLMARERERESSQWGTGATFRAANGELEQLFKGTRAAFEEYQQQFGE